ncbi:tetratricopeptide repeat protein [Pseudomonas sp. Hp2]|uniref:tetratricopeptide repeat protein n=1 Tax=Pseudomonas sp. Hp2 TaxID=701189 RepID=UPI001C499FC4|nr:tetratricopeptide repeat protein [Pseudomonas sp. Hp2]
MISLASFVLATALAVAPAPESPPSSPPPPPPAVDTLMAIPPELRHMLQQRVMRRSPPNSEERLQRLVDLLFSQDGLGLQYGASDTHSVAESFATRRVNCLSFTMLFLALAREAGLSARPQEVGQVLSWYEQGGIGYNYGHINAQVRMNAQVATIDLDSNILMDRRGPRVISDLRLFAHYYNNRGAELISDGQFAQARPYFEQALRIDPKLADAWNNLGVLNAHENALDAAAADYAQALALDARHAASISNALNVYRRLGDTQRAAQMLARLQQVQARDPFHQYVLGTEAERQGDYATASRYYAKAIRLYPNAHQFHFGLARVAFLTGDGRLADRELRLAHTLAPASEQQRYQAKLDSLRRWSRSSASLRP